MNTAAIIIIVIVGLIFIGFLIIKNNKDRKDYEKQMNEDYPRKHEDSSNTATDNPKL